MAEHSPTPYRFHERPDFAQFAGPICNEAGECVCEIVAGEGVKWKANAAFILRACNSHDDLVAALKALVGEDAPCSCDDWMIVAPGGKCSTCVARAALAKATGGDDA